MTTRPIRDASSLLHCGRLARRATLLRAGQSPLEPLPAAVTGGRMPDESHTNEPWTAANESNPPATSTQPGRAEVVDQIKQVAAIRALHGVTTATDLGELICR